MGRPDELWTDPIFHSGNIRNLPPGHDWCPGENLDRLPQASHATGGTPSESYVFRMLGNNFQLERLQGLDPSRKTGPISGPACLEPRGAPGPGSAWLLGTKDDIAGLDAAG